MLLAALAIGIPWTRYTGPTEPVIQVTLMRPPPLAPETRPPPPRREPRKTRPVETNRTPPPEATRPAPPHAAPPATAAPEIDAGEKAAAGDVMRALRATVGCANPDAVGLSPAERAACRKSLRAALGEVKPMSGLTAEKTARFDRAVRCHEEYQNAQIPSSFSKSEEPDDMSGLGHVPRMRDCPPSAQ